MNNCSQNGSEGRSADSSAAVEPHNLHYQERDRFSLDREVCISTTNGPPIMANELPNVKRECASPEIYVGASGTKKPDFEFSKFKIRTFPAKVIEVDSMDGGPSNKKQIKVENSKKVSEWKKFIRDPSTKENQYEKQDEKNVDSGALSFITEVLQAPNKSIKESQTIESLCPIKSSENHGRAAKLNETIPMPDVRARAAVAEEVVHHAKSEIDAKSSSQQQQSTGSLCLVSEMSGSHYRKLLSDPAGSSVVTNSASSRSTKKKKIFVANKLGSSKISSVHPDVRNLASEVVERACNVQIDDVQQNENAFEEKRKKSNSVGETGSCKRCSCKKSKCLKLYCECFTAGVYCTGSCNCQDCFNKPAHEDTVRETRRRIASRNPLAFAHKYKWSTYPASTIYETGCNSVRSLVPPLASEVVERACNVQIDDVQLNENASEKKRKKSDSAGETDSCKRCSCKKSKCLKLYCECFTAGVYCIGLCNCRGCFNKPAHEDTVVQTRRLIESRNPFAFVAKRISSANKLNKIPASSGYKRGCNCMKSVCLKKYCECFQGGVGCSRSCTCKGCENTFGQKEGIEGIVFEEAKILNECPSGVGSLDEFQITDQENKAPHEHSNVKGPQVSLLPCGQSLQSRTSLQSNDVDHTILWGKDIAVLDGVASEALSRGAMLCSSTTMRQPTGWGPPTVDMLRH